MVLPTGLVVSRPPTQLPTLVLKKKMQYVRYTNIALTVTTVCMLATYTWLCQGVQ